MRNSLMEALEQRNEQEPARPTIRTQFQKLFNHISKVDAEILEFRRRENYRIRIKQLRYICIVILLVNMVLMALLEWFSLQSPRSYTDHFDYVSLAINFGMAIFGIYAVITGIKTVLLFVALM